MEQFLTWINTNLIIGPHPSKFPRIKSAIPHVNFVINVSDLMDFSLHHEFVFQGIEPFWFPMGESFGFPLENIYGALQVLWHAEKYDKKVLLHCYAGRNRSITVADCYYFIRTGKHRTDNDQTVDYAKYKNNQLLLNINDNQLPGIFRMDEFLEKCGELFDTPSLAKNAAVDWLKKETFGY